MIGAMEEAAETSRKGAKWPLGSDRGMTECAENSGRQIFEVLHKVLRPCSATQCYVKANLALSLARLGWSERLC